MEDYARALRNGYGKGVGLKYKPWLTVRDVPSDGESTIVQGITNDRPHHLLSLLERKTFYGLEHKRNVIDIREQFPLLPLDVVMGLADRYGITYPRVPRTSTPAVLSTDFLVTLQGGAQEDYLPVACKYASELLIAYELEKLEIQRLFWASLGLQMALITEQDIDESAAENLRFISSYFREDRQHLPPLDRAKQLPELFEPGTYDFGLMTDRVIDLGANDDEHARRAIFWLIWNHDLEINLSVDMQRTGFIEVVSWNDNVSSRLSGEQNANIA